MTGEIVSRLVALMPGAVVRIVQGSGPPLKQAHHNGLMIWFYDSTSRLPGDLRARISNKLCIEVREGLEQPGQRRVFKAYVNPDARTYEIKQCRKGAWRVALLSPAH